MPYVDICMILPHCWHHVIIIALASWHSCRHQLKQRLSVDNCLSNLMCYLYRWLVWHRHHCWYHGIVSMVSLLVLASQCHLCLKQRSCHLVAPYLILMCDLCISMTSTSLQIPQHQCRSISAGIGWGCQSAYTIFGQISSRSMDLCFVG